MINFNKTNGLVPVIIHDDRTLQVLMLGYMNEEAFEKTKNEAADLLYYFLILLKTKNFSLLEIEEILLNRNQ